MAAKSGTPAMTAMQPTAPVSIPAPGSGVAATADVTASSVSDSTALDTQPDARQNPPGSPQPAPTKDQNATPQSKP
jgi:hypothetical protein